MTRLITSKDYLINSTIPFTNLGSFIIFNKRLWGLVYSEQNCKVRKVLRNAICCLEDWELEKTDFSRKIKTPDKCIQ